MTSKITQGMREAVDAAPYIADIQRWRDDAFEAAAQIAERHGCVAVALDIRALIKTVREGT